MNNRLRSIDTLRGFDMLFIMGGGGLLTGLAVLFPTPFFQALAEQTEHVDWNGLRAEDMIFPLFLFIAGISFPFSLDAQRQKKRTNAQIVWKIFTRGITLVLLGAVYNGFLQFDFANQRYASVLGRIGLAWMFAALLYVYAGRTMRLIVAPAILLLYWGALAAFGEPNNQYTMEGSLVGMIDRLCMPGALYCGIHDPEGLFSTVPAIVTAMLGMFAGKWVKEGGVRTSELRKVAGLAAGGAVLIAIGCLWNEAFPINKNLWSSSFVCVAGGISAVLFAIFYYLVDVRGITWWTGFFVVIGMNSITIYMAQQFVSFGYTSHAIFSGVISCFPETAHPLLSAAAYVAVCWGFLYFLYRRKIFLKV